MAGPAKDNHEVLINYLKLHIEARPEIYKRKNVWFLNK